MAKKMWSFKTKNFKVVWEIERDVLDTRYMDPDLAKECRAKVRTGEWKCFTSTVRVEELGSGVTLGEAYLGNSIYANPAEFRDHLGMKQRGHGSYFSDMVREAVAMARQAFPAHQARLRAEIDRRKSVLAVQLRSQQQRVGIAH